MDELSTYLLGEKNHASISPESLELMGKRAATRFLEEGIQLNDSIAKLAGEHADISPEQIKRVVEFANTAVYLAKHDQDKNAGADHSYPQFELADAERVLQDLSDGARPTIVTKTDVDYSRQVNKPKISSAAAEDALTELFKSAGVERDFSSETIASNLIGLKESLQNLGSNLQTSYDMHLALFKEATADFYKETKSYLLDGGSLAEVYCAAKASGADDSTVKEALGPVVAQLIQEKVAAPEKLQEQMKSLSKFASSEVETEHPLVKTFAAAMLAGNELNVLHRSLSDTHRELELVQSEIQKSYFDAPAS